MILWRLLRGVRDFLRGKDLALHAAAVTFYGGVLVDAGLRMSLPLVLVALIPATWYGEGLRRAFVSLAAPDRSAAGWRGRLLILPILAAGPLLLLALLSVLPAAARMLRRGGWTSVWSVILSFLVVWVVLSVIVILVYRVVGPLRPRWTVTVLCGAFTAANLSGFAHGFVLFWSLPLDLGVPFGGLDAVGAVVAVTLWLYLFHVIALLGYAVTLSVNRLLTRFVDDFGSVVSTR
jgi:membrane protein